MPTKKQVKSKHTPLSTSKKSTPKKKGSSSVFFTDTEQLESYSIANQFAEHLEFSLVKDKTTATKDDIYQAIAKSVRDRMIRKWLRSRDTYRKLNPKRVNYLSLEFLMGRLLGNTLLNLGFYDECYRILDDLGYSLEELREREHDMGLGNGGLGRLAACYLDSLATLEYPAYGYGLRYEFGIFEQDIQNGYQVEKPDPWLSYGNPWELVRPDHTYRVKFGGHVQVYNDENGEPKFSWENTDDVVAVAYDVPVPGYGNNTVNILRLWQARATTDFNFEYFNRGDYLAAVEQKAHSETISKVLYPNDSMYMGKMLRLKQQFFFVSATIQDILSVFKSQKLPLSKFPEKNAIQLNDTHPSLAIPEFMHQMLDIENIGWDQAWEITKKTFGYTNHTVMPEALEVWPAQMVQQLLPRHYQIILEINRRFLEEAKSRYTTDPTILSHLSIIEEGAEKKIRMPNLAIVGSHAINGVAKLHTEILKNTIFSDFYKLYPEKFQNVTNGITQRRWLTKANPYLSNLISDHIGDGFNLNLEELKKLEKFADDTDFQSAWQQARWVNKQIFSKYIATHYGVKLDPESIFDSHVKRFHEYKRQLLNVLHVITLYNRIKDNPKHDGAPRTVFFGGKAAPGYMMAKYIIKLINSIAEIVNSDPDTRGKLKVVFLKNYSVSLAEKIIPATDLSEQISTAGYEASGTGNMKFGLNGALTIGTMDGATIEMAEEIGEENMFIFGLHADQISDLKKSQYNPLKYYEENGDLRRVLDMIQHDYFNKSEPGIFKPIIDGLLYHGDRYCLLADYNSYIKAQLRVEEIYKDKTRWTKMSILNTARSGKFSSDRAVREYAENIWGLKPVKIKTE
jgi:starch phosphorylase